MQLSHLGVAGTGMNTIGMQKKGLQAVAIVEIGVPNQWCNLSNRTCCTTLGAVPEDSRHASCCSQWATHLPSSLGCSATHQPWGPYNLA